MVGRGTSALPAFSTARQGDGARLSRRLLGKAPHGGHLAYTIYFEKLGFPADDCLIEQPYAAVYALSLRQELGLSWN
jgi:hypothetical protein